MEHHLTHSIFWLTVAWSYFILTVASPIGNFLQRYLELGTGTPYHETESLADFSRSFPVKLLVKISSFKKLSAKNSLLAKNCQKATQLLNAPSPEK